MNLKRRAEFKYRKRKSSQNGQLLKSNKISKIKKAGWGLRAGQLDSI